MKFNEIETFFPQYSKALDWAMALTNRTEKENRFFQYKQVLENHLKGSHNGVKQGRPDQLELFCAAEALLESSVLIEIHEKFSKNTNKYFVEKLDNVFGGKYFAS